MQHILAIEDDHDIRENIEELLILEGLDVHAADNGRTGLELAQKFLPDLIICDVMMPDMDGFEVLTALRQDERTATIPVIMLTAKANRSDIRHGMELGADDYLTKPFTPAELLRAIDTQRSKKVALQERAEAQLSALRSNITRSLPHELNTPLNGILSTCSLLIGDYQDMEEEEVKEMLEAIYTSGKRLHKLIKSFLLYAELELIASDPSRLRALKEREELAEAKSELEIALAGVTKAWQRSQDCTINVAPAILSMSSVHLQAALDALMDNACKFSTSGTPIQVSGRRGERGDRYVIEITDHGRGMTPEQTTTLGAYMQFERRIYEQQGSGLGLAITQRIAQIYNGVLSFTSEPGQFTTARLELVALPD